MISPMMAARAYSAVQNAGRDTAKTGGLSDGPDFSQMVNSAMTDVIGSSRKAETLIAAHTQGKAELVDVATAVASAQASLNTVIAVRDQVISAYKEIMSMSI